MSDEQRRNSSNDDLARQIRQTMTRNERSGRPQNRKRPQSSSGRAAVRTKKKSMSPVKAVVITVCIILVLVIIFLMVLYFKGLREAQGKFLKNTTINSVNVSEMTEAEAYNAVKQTISVPENVELLKVDGTKIEIPLETIGYKDNIRATIEIYMSQQNYYLWFSRSTPTNYNFDASFKYDSSLLTSELKRRIINSAGKSPAKDAYIKHTGSGFEIVKEVIGDNIDESKLDPLVEYVKGELDKGNYQIDLAGIDLYQKPKVLAGDLTQELERLENLDKAEITINFIYENAVLTGEEFMEWVTFDEEDALKGYTVDYDKTMAYVEKLAAKYDTYKTTRTFKTTKRGKMKIEQGEGCYGFWIDQERMCKRLISLIEEGDSVTIDPIYYVNPNNNYVYECDPKYRTAKTDIGNTYCEVDLTAQHFWYYEDGKMKYETDIVSGKPTEERNTPAGIYKVWLKEKNKVLTGSTAAGESWSTPCTYWNNISTFGVGLHDSSWRSAFGGDIYKYNGSHGCINMPVNAAKYVFENVDYGTPVIMYW